MSRVQTGVRIEKGLLKVLKAVAEYEEVSLGALLERIVLSSFMGERAFDDETLGRISELSRVYGLNLEMADRSEEYSAADEAGASPTAPEPDRSPATTEPGPLEAAEESDLAEALDGLSRMLGVDD